MLVCIKYDSRQKTANIQQQRLAFQPKVDHLQKCVFRYTSMTFLLFWPWPWPDDNNNNNDNDNNNNNTKIYNAHMILI